MKNNRPNRQNWRRIPAFLLILSVALNLAVLPAFAATPASENYQSYAAASQPIPYTLSNWDYSILNADGSPHANSATNQAPYIDIATGMDGTSTLLSGTNVGLYVGGYYNTSADRYFQVKPHSVGNFRLISFKFEANTNTDSSDGFTVLGYRAGTPVATQSFAMPALYAVQTITLNSSFENIDEFRIVAYKGSTSTYISDVNFFFDDMEVTDPVLPSKDATLSGGQVKGAAVSNLGTANSSLSGVTAGAVTISSTAAADTTNAGSYITRFTGNNSGATVKVVKYASGASTASFDSAAAYNNEAVSNGDFFVVRVTAADTSVLYYQVSVTVLSDVATLSSGQIKGVTVSNLGTANSSLSGIAAGALTLTAAQAAGNGTTSFTPADSGAAVKVVKYASGASTTNFDSAAAYNNEAVSDGDFFVVRVTSAYGTSKYYQINVTVPSNDATLSGGQVKGAAVSNLGTANGSLSGVTAGAVTISSTAAADTTNAGSYITRFTGNNSGATVKVVKYASGANAASFDSDTAYTGGAVSNGDFFVVRVTAADTSVLYYQVSVTVLSDVATLSSGQIKGATVSDLGTANSSLSGVIAGTLTLTAAQAAGNGTTSFTPTDSGAAVKVVKYASGASTTNFDSAAAYNNEAVSDGDFFVVRVTSAYGTSKYYQINVTVPSNDATLSSGQVKGAAVSNLGTANTTVESVTNSGSVTLTTAQAAGNGTTSFTSTNNGATVKVVKYASGDIATTANFDSAIAYTGGAVSSGDFFVVRVTAADTSVLYYKIAVMPSFTVTYVGGSATGTVPTDRNAYDSGATVTVLGNIGSLSRAGFTFAGWTANGTTYTAGKNFSITADTTLTAAWTAVTETYTVTYNENYMGGAVNTVTSVASGATLTKPTSPTRTGYAFLGWYKQASCVDNWNFAIDAVTENTTLYAKWVATTSVYTVTGTIKDDALAAISGAAIQLVQGQTQLASTTTDSNGQFTISGIPNGSYNLILTKDNRTVTITVTVSGENYDTGTVTLPRGNTSTTVSVVGTETPDVVVDGLGNLFGSSTTNTDDSKGYTSNDASIVTSGGSVVINLKVQKNDNSANGSTVIASMASSGYSTGMVLDVDLIKVTTTASALTSTASITQTSDMLTIVIPLPSDLQSKSDYILYRAHDYGSGAIVESISTAHNANGEYLEINSDKTQLIAHLKYFCTYAIGYTAAAPTVPAGSETSAYSITALSASNGSVKLGTSSAASGTKVTVTVTPNEGYALKTLTVKDAGGSAVSYTDNKNGTYTFTMPASAVTVSAVFNKIPTSPDVTGVSTLLQTVDHIKYISGYLDGAVGPERNMTRGEAAQMFYNLLLEQSAAESVRFSDVADTLWCAKAINKLASVGIIKGYDNGAFGVNDPITREQFCAMAVRFAAKIKTGSVDGTSAFSDVKSGTWSYDSVMTAASLGWINGYSDGSFGPQDNITRAQVVTIVNHMLGRAADKSFVDASAGVKTFSDLSKAHWAYYDLMEAANAHDYKTSGGSETWSALK